MKIGKLQRAILDALMKVDKGIGDDPGPATLGSIDDPAPSVEAAFEVHGGDMKRFQSNAALNTWLLTANELNGSLPKWENEDRDYVADRSLQRALRALEAAGLVVMVPKAFLRQAPRTFGHFAGANGARQDNAITGGGKMTGYWVPGYAITKAGRDALI